MTQEETRQGVRRRVRLSVVAPVAALACLVAIMLGPSMLGLSLFGAGDLISSRAPWVEGNPSTQIANRCVADTIDSTIPSLLSTKARIFDGDLVPLWEDSASGGATLAATPAQGVTSPLAMAALLAPDPAVTAWLKFFEIAAIALGMVLWARRLGLSIGAGAVGALVFATSAFMVLWTNWPQTRTAAIFPLLFWAVERILQDRTWRSAAPFPLVLAAMFLGGFPAIAVHAVYFAVVYAIVRWVALRRTTEARPGAVGFGRPLLLLAAGGLAAVALTAFQLVPWALELASADLGYRADQWREIIPRGYIVTTAFPLTYGTCGTQIPYWGATNPIEGTSFVGAAAIVLCVAALTLAPPARARAARWFFVGGGAFALVVTFFGGAVNFAFQMMPLVGGNSLHRVRAVGALMFAMLAAMGYDAIRRSGGTRKALAWSGVVAGPLLVVAMALRVEPKSPTPEVWQAVMPSVVVGTLSAVLVGSLWAATMLARSDRRRRVAAGLVAALVPVLVLIEGLVFTSAFWPRTPPETLYPMTRTTAFLQENLGTERMVGHGAAYWRGAGRVNDLRSLDGHTFVTEDWRTMLHAVDPHFFESPTTHTLASLDYIDSPVLDRLATAYVVSDLVNRPPGTLDGDGEQAGGSVRLDEVPATRVLDGDDRVRALVIDVVDVRSDAEGLRFVVEITDSAGSIVAAAERRVRGTERHRTVVPIAAERLAPGTQLAAELRVEGPGSVAVVADIVGEPWVGVIVARPDDPTVLVHTADAQIYERTQVLDRFRWASRSEPCAAAASCAAMMPGLDPASVLLDEGGTVPFDDLPATVDVLLDSDDLKRVEVRAEGAGMLVLADALQRGWVARVDGERVELHRADGAMKGVAVPAGTHVVELGYEPTGWTGLPALALVTALATIAYLARPALTRSRRPSSPAPSDPSSAE